MPPIVVITLARAISKNFVTIMKEGIGHILDLTRIGEKRKECLKRLTLTSYTYMERTMWRLIEIGK